MKKVCDDLIEIPDDHELKFTRGDKNNDPGRDDEDWYYEEFDSEGVLVARYHRWSYESTVPPHVSDCGVKKFAPSGELLQTLRK